MANWWEDLPTAPQQPASNWWDALPTPKAPTAADRVVDVAKDVAASGASGAARGTAELAMSTVTIPQLMRQGTDWLVEKGDALVRSAIGAPQLTEAQQVQRRSSETRVDPFGRMLEGGVDAARKAMDENLYKPRTTAGEYARTAGEFIPGALLPGRTVGNAIRYGIVPGIASEAAGQATKGTAYEPWARAGAGVVAGVGMGITQRPATGQQVLENAAGGPIPRAELQLADDLMRDAATRGVSLTPIEALNQATGGKYRRLAGMQRLVENSPGGAPVLDDFMAQRPGQVQTAARVAMDDLAPNPALPGDTGRAIQKAAGSTIDETQRGINTVTRPYYQSVEQVRLNPADAQRLMSDPLYAQTLAEVRSNAALNKTIANFPDDSVGVVDMVQRRMRESADNLRVPGQASTSNTAAAAFEDARSIPIAAADSVTGGPSGGYATARAAQQSLRERFLEPLTEGRMGKLRSTPDVGTQTREVLFPAVPQAGSAPEVGTAVKQLVRQNPKAATDLVGQHARTVFAQATENLASGPNQFGGSKFATAIRGNAEQAASLEAAVKALPGGNQKWNGFSRFLDVMEATGQRLQVGSATAFNQQGQEELRGRGAIKAVAGLKSEIMRRWDQHSLAGNSEAVAQLLTNSTATDIFKRLAKENGVTPQAVALTHRLQGIMASNASAFDRAQERAAETALQVTVTARPQPVQ
jgi:hypothetical protein